MKIAYLTLYRIIAGELRSEVLVTFWMTCVTIDAYLTPHVLLTRRSESKYALIVTSRNEITKLLITGI